MDKIYNCEHMLTFPIANLESSIKSINVLVLMKWKEEKKKYHPVGTVSNLIEKS